MGKKKDFLCSICTAPMEMVSKKYSRKRRSNEKYRIRRFKCTVCDFEETVYADGQRDELFEPRKAIDKVNREFRKEEDARD